MENYILMTVPIATKNIQSTTAFKADIARLKFGLIKLICDKNPAPRRHGGHEGSGTIH